MFKYACIPVLSLSLSVVAAAAIMMKQAMLRSSCWHRLVRHTHRAPKIGPFVRVVIRVAENVRVIARSSLPATMVISIVPTFIPRWHHSPYHHCHHHPR